MRPQEKIIIELNNDGTYQMMLSDTQLLEVLLERACRVLGHENINDFTVHLFTDNNTKLEKLEIKKDKTLGHWKREK